MADYYPLIARAVTGLDKSTGEARRALYERARTALVTQLRGVEPALSETDITRERLALEEAIRKVEAEAARRPRQEPPEPPDANLVPPLPRFEKPASFAPPSPPPPPEARFAETPPPPPPDWEELQRELDGIAPPPSPEPESFEAPEHDRDAPEPSPPEKSADEPPLPFEPESRPDFTPPAEPESPPEPTPPSRKPFSTEHPSLVDEGLKGFRDVIAETDDLGGATASASKSARETRDAFSALPPSSEIERTEPRLDPRIGKRIDPQDLTPQDLRPSGPEFRLPSPRPPPQRPESRTGVRPRPITPPPAPPEFDELEEQELRSGLGGGARKIISLAVILVLAAAAFFAYREWGSSVTGLFQSARGPATQASKEAPQARPKISDRIGGAQQDQAARPSTGAGAAVAQRAVLYEQQPTGQERKQYVGSVIWRTETVSPGPGQPPDIAIRADVEIPERHIRMSLTVRRNLDPSLPASHTIEILFSTPADFPPGGIADLAGVVMEDAEQSRGVPLAGTRVKVTNGFFLVGLSSVEGDVRRNVQSLKDRAWMHIRMAYNDGQRALLAIEKGVPGDRVFEDAFNAWNQAPPAAQR